MVAWTLAWGACIAAAAICSVASSPPLAAVPLADRAHRSSGQPQTPEQQQQQQHRGCNTSPTPDLDRCPGGPPGYRTAEVTPAAAAADCAALCCADPGCAVWVTRPTGAAAAGNCSAGSSCCWTKPPCSGTLASPGTTSGTALRPNPNFSFVDTAGWVGTEYTPARAANSLWWARFPEYEADVERELGAARAAFGLRVLRIFLHTLAFESLGPALHAQYLQRFIAIAEAHGMSVGIVLFGDGWNHGRDLPHAGNTGANASCVRAECCPRAADGSVGVRGCHNGCWFANPQDHQRGDPPASFDGQGGSNASFIAAQFRPYVEAVVRPLLHDPRVLWWEAYNEPCAWRHYAARICTYFEVATSTMLKELSYGWVKAMRPRQPVISNWAEANNTFSEILDVHLYSSDFRAWSAQIFAECPAGAGNASLCNRGAVVTEVRKKDAKLAQKLGQPQPSTAMLYSRRNAWANLRVLGQPNYSTLLARGGCAVVRGHARGRGVAADRPALPRGPARDAGALRAGVPL
jgi:hypothetical protein